MKKTLSRNEIGPYIKKCILSEYVSLADAAHCLDMPKQTIYNIVYGVQHPTDEILHMIGYELVKTIEYKKVKK